MSRSVRTDYTALRNPMHISEVLAETFKRDPSHTNLTAWVDSQPMPGQMELTFADEVASEFVEVPC